MKKTSLLNLTRTALAGSLALVFCLSPGSLGRVEAVEGLAPYPSPEQAVAEVRGLAEKYPGQVELLVAGQSAGGRDLLVLRIHQGDGQARPAALIAGAIHGDEYIANRTAFAVAVRLLADNDPLATKVLDRMDVFVLPLINPDAYAKTWKTEGKAASKITRTNDRGVDLNRNFGKPRLRVDMPLGYSGAKDPDSSRWVGPAPLSEPESRAVQTLTRKYRFFAAVDFHSLAGMIIPVLEDDRWTQRGLRKMAQAYRGGQADQYSIAMFPWWLPIYQGSMEECLYREAGTLAILIELGKTRDVGTAGPTSTLAAFILPSPDNFWAYNPRDPETIKRISEDNAKAALSALLAAHEYTQGKTEPKPIEVVKLADGPW